MPPPITTRIANTIPPIIPIEGNEAFDSEAAGVGIKVAFTGGVEAGEELRFVVGVTVGVELVFTI